VSQLKVCAWLISKSIGIRQLRTKILAGYEVRIAKIYHKMENLYSLPHDSNNVMLNGVLDYYLQNGDKLSNIPWAVRAKLDEDGDRLRLSFYQVYLVRCGATQEHLFVAHAL